MFAHWPETQSLDKSNCILHWQCAVFQQDTEKVTWQNRDTTIINSPKQAEIELHHRQMELHTCGSCCVPHDSIECESDNTALCTYRQSVELHPYVRPKNRHSTTSKKRQSETDRKTKNITRMPQKILNTSAKNRNWIVRAWNTTFLGDTNYQLAKKTVEVKLELITIRQQAMHSVKTAAAGIASLIIITSCHAGHDMTILHSSPNFDHARDTILR